MTESTTMNTGRIIRFPEMEDGPSRADQEAALERALAIALRNYRNGFGVNKARSGIFAQMYVLGIVDTPDLVLRSLGVTVPNFKETKE